MFFSLEHTSSLPFFCYQCSTRISNELGAEHPQAARLALHVVLVIALSEGVVVWLVLVLIRNVWGYAYSNEAEVVTYVATMMPILATSNLIDGLQCVLSGINHRTTEVMKYENAFPKLRALVVVCAGAVRGCGWQKMGAFINLGSYYLVGIPMSILLAFVAHIGGKVPV